jgi:hypothetical protein
MEDAAVGESERNKQRCIKDLSVRGSNHFIHPELFDPLVLSEGGHLLKKGEVVRLVFE